MTQQNQSTKAKLLAAIETFIKAKGMTPESFGWAAIKDSYLVERLKNGGDITTGKADAILRYIHSNINQGQ